MSNRALLLFCVLAYVLSWGMQLAAIHAVGNPENPAATPYLLGAMAVPALVTLGFALFSRDARRSILWKPSWRMLPLLVVAFVVPTVIAFATLAAVTLPGLGHAGWFTFAPDRVSVSGGPWLFGRGSQSWLVFVANVLCTGGAFAALNAIPAIGEELGWRGFLQGHLIERFGVTRGVVLLGLIWSAWHLPALLAGYNFPEHPVLGAFVLFPASLVAASFFLCWLTVRAGSFWPAAIAHGATNSIEEGVTANLHVMVPHIVEDLLRLAITVAVGLLFWVLLVGLRRRRVVPALSSVDSHRAQAADRVDAQVVMPARP